MRRALLLIAAAALVAACATPDPPPASSATAPSQAQPAPPGPPGIVLPPRPRDIPLDDVDPCALLTSAQRAELGLDGNALPVNSTSPVFGGRACSISGFEPRAVVVGLSLATGNGIEAVIAPGAVTDQLTPVTVGGFPAVLARPRNADFCAIDIDVAAGQFLDIQFADGGRLPPIPQEQLCQDALEVAEVVVDNLLSD